jgi:hypothetical protein
MKRSNKFHSAQMKTSTHPRHHGLWGTLIFVFMLDATSQASKPIVHLKFDEASGLVAMDSRNRHNGSLSPSGATFQAGGKSGNAIRLERSKNGTVNLGDVLPITTNSFTICGWLKVSVPGDPTQGAAMLSKHNPGTEGGYFLTVNSMFGFGQDSKAVMYAGSATDPLNSTTAVNDGEWHHVVGIYEAGVSKRLYVDGVPAEASGLAQPIEPTTSLVVIGGVSDSGRPLGLFDGLIDDIQVYDVALSDEEVAFLHANPGLAADGSTGTTYHAGDDFSASSNPNGVWSYGWLPAARFPFFLSLTNTPSGLPGLSFWQGKPGNPFFGVPNLAYNFSTNDILLDNAVFRSRKITAVPGPSGELAAIRWTAPQQGQLALQADFTGRDPGTTSRAYVINPSGMLYSAEVLGFGTNSLRSFATNLTVAAGDSIIFGVDYGSNQIWNYDSTEVEVAISYLSEPAKPVSFVPVAGRFTNSVVVSLATALSGAEIRYSLDGSTPGMASPRYTAPLTLTNRTLITARAFVQGFAVGDAVTALYERVYVFPDDGIPDAWRQTYFGPDFATNPDAAADADSDGDGSSNHREYLAGTNPLDPASGVSLGIRAVPELRWLGVSNVLYRVLRRSAVMPGAWDVIAQVQGTNGTATYLDFGAALPASYYALELVR